MAFTSGVRLGPYEILGPLGAGGMGEVYRARDTRLERTVAIKVMPPHVSADPAARERFDREARVVSSLDHPNICALYDVGRLRPEGASAGESDVDFLVMQYLEGETLAERVARGPMPFEELLRYGIEIASGLDAAHRAGVVHRDLKPGNVMLTATGARLLDFGLAKSGAAAIAGSVSIAPTAEQPLTAQGTILGTFQYMSPEQVEGREADHRTDIFALGCVLYEMATGRRPFSGSTPASLIGAILHVDPPSISSVRAQSVGDAAARPDASVASFALSRPVPAAFERLVRKCLAKEPGKRWQCAADLADELRWIAEASVPAEVAADARPQGSPADARRRRVRERMAWASAALFALAAAGTAAWTLLRSEPTPLVVRAVLPVEGELSMGLIHTLAISPRGTHVAYSAALSGGRPQLVVRAIDQRDGVAFGGTEDAAQPFFSPDGQWIGFFAGGKLKRVAVTGGTPLMVCDTSPQTRGGAWGPDDTIVFSNGPTSGLFRVSAQGGTPETVTVPDSTERGHRWPSFLPNGDVLFSIVRGAGTLDESRVAVLSLKTRQHRIVFDGGNYPRYSPTGHLLVARSGALLAVRFDASTLTTSGGPVAVVDGVAMSNTNGASMFAVAETGTLVYTRGSIGAAARALVLADRKGNVAPLLPPRAYLHVRYSPDGRRLALTIVDTSQDIWIHDLDRKTTTRVTFGSNYINMSPVWMPDGRRLVFGSTAATSTPNIYWTPADGSAREEHLLRSKLSHLPTSVSRDAQFVLYSETGAGTGEDLWVMPLNGERKPRLLAATPFSETAASFSPDGRWIAYQSDSSGRPEVYVEPFSGPGGKFQISTDGGVAPRWTADGRELLFRSGNAIMSAAVRLEPAFSHSTPVRLFDASFTGWDVSPDGKQFALVQAPPQERGTVSQLHLIVNWFHELKQKVPVK